MFRGNTQAFNAVAQDGYNPAAAEAAQRRLKDHQDIDKQQGHQRQLSGAAKDTGELKTAPGAARSIADEMARGEEKERRRRIDDVMMLSSIENARDFAAQRGRDAANLEDQFEARFGDAWREEIANRVMDPDEIPERLDGESMEDYRERLTDALIERMIDPETGEIRPEYRDDPEMRQYAEWAQARYDERVVGNAVDVLNDPDSTPEERRAATNTIDSFDEIRAMRREADRLSPDVEPDVDQVLEARTDNIRDTAVNVASEAGFGGPS